jgi:hypothetical protein
MVTWVFIQPKAHFMQDVVHRLDVDTRYRFIHKFRKQDAHKHLKYT